MDKKLTEIEIKAMESLKEYNIGKDLDEIVMQEKEKGFNDVMTIGFAIRKKLDIFSSRKRLNRGGSPAGTITDFFVQEVNKSFFKYINKCVDGENKVFTNLYEKYVDYYFDGIAFSRKHNK